MAASMEEDAATADSDCLSCAVGEEAACWRWRGWKYSKELLQLLVDGLFVWVLGWAAAPILFCQADNLQYLLLDMCVFGEGESVMHIQGTPQN